MNDHNDVDDYERCTDCVEHNPAIIGPRASGGRGIIAASQRYIDPSKETCHPRSYTNALRQGFHLEPSVNCVDLVHQLNLENQLHGMSYWLNHHGSSSDDSSSTTTTNAGDDNHQYETTMLTSNRSYVPDTRQVAQVHGNNVRNFNEALERYNRRVCNEYRA